MWIDLGGILGWFFRIHVYALHFFAWEKDGSVHLIQIVRNRVRCDLRPERYRNLNACAELKGRIVCASGNAQELGGVCWSAPGLWEKIESRLSPQVDARAEKHPPCVRAWVVCVNSQWGECPLIHNNKAFSHNRYQFWEPDAHLLNTISPTTGHV